MQLFLSWALNEACRIFNLVAQGRQDKFKIILEQGVGPQQKQPLPLLDVCLPALRFWTRMDLVFLSQAKNV